MITDVHAFYEDSKGSEAVPDAAVCEGVPRGTLHPKHGNNVPSAGL